MDAKDKKAYDKACKEGTGVHPRVWRKLNRDERDKVMKAKESKGNRKPRGERDQDGGLCTQYNVQQQLSNLPRGTIL
eukprot:1750359-Ditylum_brightwellii.AAC.1